MSIEILRCVVCGDTFSVEEGADRVCPSCGSTQVEIASEPLL